MAFLTISYIATFPAKFNSHDLDAFLKQKLGSNTIISLASQKLELPKIRHNHKNPSNYWFESCETQPSIKRARIKTCPNLFRKLCQQPCLSSEGFLSYE